MSGTLGSSTKTWSVDWTSPSSFLSVDFYVCAITANGDGGNSGDQVYTSVYTTTEQQLTTSWDCDGQGNCSDPGTGNGQYLTQAACLSACITSIQEKEQYFSVFYSDGKINIENAKIRGIIPAALTLSGMFVAPDCLYICPPLKTLLPY